MISFKANPIKPMFIKETYDFVDVNRIFTANFVELNPFDKNDIKTMNRVQRIYGNWGADASLISDIFQYEGQKTERNVNSRFFALTKQESEFDRLSPTSVLGLAKTTDMAENGVFIDMIQVNPWHMFNKHWDKSKGVHTKYKGCGISIIDAIKDTFKDKDLFLHSPRNLIGYFIRHGFEIIKLPENKEDALMKFSRKIKTGVTV